MSKLSEDPRIDPRLKAVFGGLATVGGRNVASREELLEEAATEAAIAGRTAFHRSVVGSRGRALPCGSRRLRVGSQVCHPRSSA